jgi:hypothetical protein
MNGVIWDVTPRGSCKNRQDLVTLMMETLSSSETSFLTRATRRKIPEEAILQASHSLQMYNHIICKITKEILRPAAV